MLKIPLLNSVWVGAGVKGGQGPTERTLDAGPHPCSGRRVLVAAAAAFLAKGFQCARHFGVLHHNARRTRALVLLTQTTANAVDITVPTRTVWRCACGHPMATVRRRMRTSAADSSCATPQTIWPDEPHPLATRTH